MKFRLGWEWRRKKMKSAVAGVFRVSPAGRSLLGWNSFRVRGSMLQELHSIVQQPGGTPRRPMLDDQIGRRKTNSVFLYVSA
jgi:hypothetical protein